MWYYQQGSNRMGPVDEATIRGLLASGQITIDTLVWTTGMGSWIPLQQSSLGAGLPTPPNAPHMPSATPQGINHAQKSRVAYIVLAIFLGNLGIHNFYAGRNNIGIIQLVITLCSLCTILLVPLFLLIHLGLFIWRVIEMITVTKDGKGVDFN
jgi:TM2 domain-containing membrane protein YozV